MEWGVLAEGEARKNPAVGGAETWGRKHCDKCFLPLYGLECDAERGTETLVGHFAQQVKVLVAGGNGTAPFDVGV